MNELRLISYAPSRTPQGHYRWFPALVTYQRLVALPVDERRVAITRMHAASVNLRAHLAFDHIYVGA